MRAYLSTLGQSLLLYSGLKSAGSPSDRHALIGFASVNLVANAINAMFGAQKKEDKHQLHYLKQRINDEILPLADEAILPSVTATLEQSHGKRANESQAHYLLQQYSVIISEFILRTAGSLSLIAPITGWGKAARNLRKGMSIRETFLHARTENAILFGAGIFSLAGKGFILAASEPDPYSPEPMSRWRHMREQFMFRLSTISEVIGCSWMGYDRFKNKNGGKLLCADMYAGFGNLAIDLGYIPRWIAPYGVREVNMSELYAHAARALQTLPPEKIAPMTDQISCELAEHFKAKGLQENDVRAEITRALNALPKSHIETGKQLHHSKPMAEQAAAQQL